MSPFELFWLYRAGAISSVAAILLVGFTIILMFVSVVYIVAEEYDSVKHRIRNAMPAIFFAWLSATLVTVFTPNTKEQAAMHVLPKIVQGENIKQTSPELYQIAVQHLRELTEECKCQK